MVLFDGTQKLIILELDTTEVDVKTDIYSAWKQWVIQSDNAKYLQALSAIGGDPITEVMSLGTTFFLENGQKIKPPEQDIAITLNGNIYSRDGGNVFVPTSGPYNVLITMMKSNLVDTVNLSGGGGEAPTANEVATAVWDKAIASHSTQGTFGWFIQKQILTVKKYLGLK